MDARLNGRATPALLLDQALSLLRRATAEQRLRGVAAGLPLCVVLLGLYCVERVFGARAPLPLFAWLCCLAYWARFHMLSTLAGELCAQLCEAWAPPAPNAYRRAARASVGSAPREPVAAASEGAAAPAAGARFISRGVAGQLSTAMIAGVEAWAWASALWWLSQSSWLLLLVALPAMAVRGALAPSLLARASRGKHFGWAAVAVALSDTRGVRRLFAGVELLSLLGMLVLFANLYALAALVVFVASSLLGLDVGFVTALLGPDNALVLLLLLGAAALALEPLRAAISALALHAARTRLQGADLRAAIDRLSSEPLVRPGRRAPSLRLVPLVWLAAGMCVDQPARAEPLAHLRTGAELDAQARQRARAILSRREFIEPEDPQQAGSLQAWVDRMSRRRALEDSDATAPPRFEVRVPPSVLVCGALGLMLAAAAWSLRGARRARRRARATRALAASAVGTGSGRSPPADWLAAASQLAAQGAYDAALRGLYAGCLQCLARTPLGGYDTARTNGELLQQLAPGHLRSSLERLTSLFERSRYGRRPASWADFEQAHALASQIAQLPLSPTLAREPGP